MARVAQISGRQFENLYCFPFIWDSGVSNIILQQNFHHLFRTIQGGEDNDDRCVETLNSIFNFSAVFYSKGIRLFVYSSKRNQGSLKQKWTLYI